MHLYKNAHKKGFTEVVYLDFKSNTHWHKDGYKYIYMEI